MPLLIALVAAAVIVAIVARHRRPTRNCRWREDRADSKGGALIKYNCATCGAEAYRSTGQPDKCLSNLNKPGL